MFGAGLKEDGRRQSETEIRLRKELDEELGVKKKKGGASEKPHLKDLVKPANPEAGEGAKGVEDEEVPEGPSSDEDEVVGFWEPEEKKAKKDDGKKGGKSSKKDATKKKKTKKDAKKKKQAKKDERKRKSPAHLQAVLLPARIHRLQFFG